MFSFKIIKSEKDVPGALIGSQTLEQKLDFLVKENKEVHDIVYGYLGHDIAVDLFLFQTAIDLYKNNINPHSFFENGICFLMSEDLELGKSKNIKALKQYVDFFSEISLTLKQADLDPEVFFNTVLNYLFEYHPHFLKTENFQNLKKNVSFMQYIWTEATKNKINQEDFFYYNIDFLMPEAIDNAVELKNIKKLLNLFINIGLVAQKKDVIPADLYAEGANKLLSAYPELIQIKNHKKLTIILEKMINIFRRTGDSTRESIGSLFNELTLEKTKNYLDFFSSISLKFPRLADTLISNILDAMDKNVIPQDLNKTHLLQIIDFIEQTNGFESVLYEAYLKYGNVFISDLKKVSQRILTDQFEIEDMYQIKKYFKNSVEEILIPLIKTRIPFSASKKSTDYVLKSFMKYGDLRGHISKYWRNKEVAKQLAMSEMQLKAGQISDPEGKVKNIVSLLKAKEGISKEKVKMAVEDYLNFSNKGIDQLDQKSNKDTVLNLFLIYAGKQQSTNEKISNLSDIDYLALEILEEFFKDKDNFPKLLKDILEEIHRENPKLFELSTIGKLKIKNVQNLIKFIKQNIFKLDSEDRKLEALAKMLMKYESEEVLNKLLKSDGLTEELRSLIELSLKTEVKQQLPIKMIIDKLLADKIADIRHEIHKYENVILEKNQDIGFRVVKGIPYSLWGFNAGVCIKEDDKLWSDSGFKLISIIDKNNENLAGFIHVYETTVRGRRIMTIPGIEPSVEFLNQANAGDLYNIIEDVLKEFARLGGYSVVYIPTASYINSNRNDIQKAIQKKNYAKIKLPEAVNWNHEPEPYPFEEVYVIPVPKR